MEVYTDDNSIKEYLSKYPFNEQSTVTSKLTRIGICYILKTNGSQHYPSLRELDSIIDTLSVQKQKASGRAYQKKTTSQKGLPKEKQFRTPTFGLKTGDTKKRPQTIEHQQIKGKNKNTNRITKNNQLPPSQYSNNIFSNDTNNANKEKQMKEPNTQKQQLKPVNAERTEKIILPQEKYNQNQYLQQQNQHQKQIVQNEKEKEPNKQDTPQSIKRIQNASEPIIIKPNDHNNNLNYHFQQENILNQERHNTNDQSNKNRNNQMIKEQIAFDKEERESEKDKQNSLMPSQKNEAKLNYDYRPMLTEPYLNSSGYSFRESTHLHHHCNCSNHLPCHCNHSYHCHYPNYSYHSLAKPLVTTESSVISQEKSKSSNQLNYIISIDYNTENANTLLIQTMSQESFTYQISH